MQFIFFRKWLLENEFFKFYNKLMCWLFLVFCMNLHHQKSPKWTWNVFLSFMANWSMSIILTIYMTLQHCESFKLPYTGKYCHIFWVWTILISWSHLFFLFRLVVYWLKKHLKLWNLLWNKSFWKDFCFAINFLF